ncbi:prolyl oligopeptidase family serine peptidase [Amycolatopsis sp. NPDC058986]|uniref:prolyl oligopeptidase family serine peptidase n=1 Tax=unclassified Amycolatopsis TaxID=2618356 RepID=UPI00366B7624
MSERSEPITGTAAGVPFTALPPAGDAASPAPLVITWHMLDAPRTNAAFAAALPMHTVPAWRIHLGMPLSGARMPEGGLAAAAAVIREDAMLSFVDAFVRQATDEFPAALTELRERFPLDDGPIGLAGGSLGGAVVLRHLVENRFPVRAAALVNPGVRARSVVGLVEPMTEPYTWTPEAHAAADRLDFVALADELAARTPQVPLLLVSGEEDHPSLRKDAVELVDALRERYTRPEDIRLTTVPGLAHPLADEPGLEPAPQSPVTKVVDEEISRWFEDHLTRP